MINLKTLAIVAAILLPGGAHAATYNFVMTYDGPSATLGAGSDTPAGTLLAIGDSFNLSINTPAGYLWEVNTDLIEVFILAAFPVEEAGTRYGTIGTNLYLGGSMVFSTAASDVEQMSYHVGTQFTTLTAGLQFDSFQVEYTLTGSDAPTLITARPDHLFGYFNSANGDFFRNPGITYQTTVVPLPAGLPLLLGALAAFGLIRRRQRGALA